MKFSIYPLTLLATMTAACSDSFKDTPLSGEVTYDVTYSEDIIKNTSVGPFLPRTVIGTFDSCNVKLTLTAPLGVGHADFVLAKDEDFVALEFDEAQLLLSMEDILSAENARGMAGGLKIVPQEEVMISNFKSHHIAVFPMTDDSIDTRLDIFFMPFPGHKMEYDATKFIEAKTSHKSTRLGVITAINMRIGQSNIMLMATDIRPDKNIKPEEFKRPQGYIQATREDLTTLYDIMTKE